MTDGRSLFVCMEDGYGVLDSVFSCRDLCSCLPGIPLETKEKIRVHGVSKKKIVPCEEAQALFAGS
jgi:hypothetical protein